MESVEISDEGDLFAEEALGCLSEEEIEAIEEAFDGPADDFMLEVYAAWDEEEPDRLIELLISMLAELDIELTYDMNEDDEDPDDDDYDDDGIWEDDDESEEADPY